jgi:hypothetical protein
VVITLAATKTLSAAMKFCSGVRKVNDDDAKVKGSNGPYRI